jgi:hypothetical protein
LVQKPKDVERHLELRQIIYRWQKLAEEEVWQWGES